LDCALCDRDRASAPPPQSNIVREQRHQPPRQALTTRGTAGRRTIGALQTRWIVGMEGHGDAPGNEKRTNRRAVWPASCARFILKPNCVYVKPYTLNSPCLDRATMQRNRLFMAS
jgi:hypothetical protein